MTDTERNALWCSLPISPASIPVQFSGSFRAARSWWPDCGCVSALVYFNGFYLEDSPGYITDAAYVALGEFRARDYITGLNVGIFAPVGLALALFGKTEAAISLWPLACSLLGMASMGAAVGVLCGRRWGVLAALLYATYPGDIFFSTVVMPDAIQAGWLTFSVLLVILAFAAPQPDVRLLSPAAQRWLCVS